jgi:hypothetical protein
LRRNASEGLVEMNVILFLTINTVALGILLCGLYLLGRVFIPELAEADSFFSSPKLGRIKAKRRGGKIIGFIDNLVGKNRSVNKNTGKIENCEQETNNLCWKLFGAIFIGLDEIYKYKIAIEAEEDGDGNIKYLEKEASSIFIEGSYPLTTVLVTRDGVRLKVKFQLKLSTLDASKALSLPVSWTIPVFTAVLGKSRSFVGSKNTITLISSQHEGSLEGIDLDEKVNSDLIKEILSLNKPAFGNISLADMCGQYIDAVNITYVGFADKETEKDFLAPFVAERKATATTLMGNAEAAVYEKKHSSLGSNPGATAQVIAAERHSTMSGLTTLVNGGKTVMAIPVENKKKEGG